VSPGLPRVTLRKRLDRAIRSGQPWIYRDALAATGRFADGALVLVAGGDGRPLARGFWDTRSPIAVRVLAPPGTDSIAAIVDARLGATLAARHAAITPDTSAFRWVHGEADGLPGLHADVYGTAVSLRFDGAGARAFYFDRLDLPRRMQAAADRGGRTIATVVERRARGAAAADAATAVLGTLPEGEIEVREHGLRFGVDLGHGQKGGLFLDQRENRALVRTLAAGRRVLNLFAYTGGFSIYAAAGGAARTTTVDVSAPAIAAARRNFARNGFATEPLPESGDQGPVPHRFVAADAFTFLTEAAAAGERFDLVISDPPSFAPNRRTLAAGLGAYRRLHRLCAAITAPGGIFCAASCSSHVDRATFLSTVQEGAAEAGRRFTLREMRGAGPDHPVVPSFPEGDYLKFAVGDL
jgi:23S rRNA (cytosine1962-C5)-methyltransferase